MSLEHVALWDKCLSIIKDNLDEVAYFNRFSILEEDYVKNIG